MKQSSPKSFVTGVLLRKPVLRAFAAEGLKLSVCVLAVCGIVVAVRYLRGEPWRRADGYDLLGACLALAGVWFVSAARTVSAAYREFCNSHEGC